jgi:transcriptional regulator with XRE-family HTH domain
MRPSRNQTLIDALGVEVKARRLELGLTQEDLAGRAELDRPYISLIEVGQKQPSVSVMFLLAKALDLPFALFAERVDLRYRKSERAAGRRRRSATAE